MRISDWSSDVCSSDLDFFFRTSRFSTLGLNARRSLCRRGVRLGDGVAEVPVEGRRVRIKARDLDDTRAGEHGNAGAARRSEEHTSELQSLMRISYAVFCLKKKKKHRHAT